MSQSELKPGDVVRLKSGGPSMTVRSVTNNGNLRCAWFIEYAHYCFEEFTVASLILDPDYVPNQQE